MQAQVVRAQKDAPAEAHDAGDLTTLDERIDSFRRGAKQRGGLSDG